MRSKSIPRRRVPAVPRRHADQGTVDWLATNEIAWGAPHTLIAIAAGLIVAWRGVTALVARRRRPRPGTGGGLSGRRAPGPRAGS